MMPTAVWAAASPTQNGVSVPDTAPIANSNAAPEYSASYRSCIDRSEGVSLAIVECDGAEFERQDKALNAVYRELTARLEPKLRVPLQKAERAWLVFRDAQCDFEYSREQGGTLAPVFFNGCRLSMTYRRIQELRRFSK